jgi:DNA-binding NarL/FixJ family response regulator
MRILLLTSPIVGVGLSTVLSRGFPQSQIQHRLGRAPDEIASILPGFAPEATLLDADHLAVLPFFESLGPIGVKKLGALLVLTSHPCEEELFACAKWGVRAYLSAFGEPEQLLAAIEAAFQGSFLLNSEILRDPVLRRLRQRAEACLQEACREVALPTEVPPSSPKRDPLPNPLKERQKQMLLLAAQGRSNQEIAALVGLTTRGMEQRFTTIYAKLQVGNRTAAVVQALRLGWIALDTPAVSEEVAS